jgi:hypothetical protein
VWSKNSSSLPVPKNHKFFNADEFIKGSGQDDARMVKKLIQPSGI